MIELCFVHADLGREAIYAPLAMHCETTALACGIGRVTVFSKGFTRNAFALKRVEAFKDYIRQAHGDVLATDCDMVWQKSPAPLFDEDFDIGLCWRTGNPGMPYYAGFVMIRHGSEAAVQFLTEWWFTIACMPKELQTWWGDQLALAAMLGQQKPNTTVDVNGCKVRIFDAGRVFFNMQSKEQTPPEGVYAIHYKGDKKELAHAA